MAKAGAPCPPPECQVEELEGFVLVAKSSCGKFQKEGEMGTGELSTAPSEQQRECLVISVQVGSVTDKDRQTREKPLPLLGKGGWGPGDPRQRCLRSVPP